MNNEYCPDRWLIVKISHPDYTPIEIVPEDVDPLTLVVENNNET